MCGSNRLWLFEHQILIIHPNIHSSMLWYLVTNMSCILSISKHQHQGQISLVPHCKVRSFLLKYLQDVNSFRSWSAISGMSQCQICESNIKCWSPRCRRFMYYVWCSADYDSAVDILKMAITLSKQSITASSDSSLVSNNLLFATAWLLDFHFLDA